MQDARDCQQRDAPEESEIFEFFKGLQSLERLVRIEEVKLMNDAGFSGEVTLDTRAVIYFRGPVSDG